MGRTKDYIIRMMDDGIDVLHPNYVSEEEYYEKYKEGFFNEIKNKKPKKDQELSYSIEKSKIK